MNVLILEGKPSTEHHVEDDSATPNINLRTGVKATANDFGCGVVRASATGFEEVAVLDLARETEVGNLDVQVIVKQNVFRLEIPMNNLEFVTVFDARHDLLEEPTSNWFGHASIGDDVFEQFATSEFEDDNDVCWGGDDFVSGQRISRSEGRGRLEGDGRTYNLMM